MIKKAEKEEQFFIKQANRRKQSEQEKKAGVKKSLGLKKRAMGLYGIRTGDLELLNLVIRLAVCCLRL